MPPVRRLTAIVAADVAGYSRLMGTDEEGTHERLKAHLGELVNPKIGEHRARVVKNTGGSWRNLRAWSMPCAARSKCSGAWPSAMKAPRRRSGSSSASASTLAM